MKPVSFLSFSTTLEHLQKREEPFVIATIVNVDGSTSAKVGSKAIFDQSGKNIFGWIGGREVENKVGLLAIQALNEKEGQLISVELDNEGFDQGVGYRKKIEIFIDPILKTEEVSLPETLNFKATAEDLAFAYGLKIIWQKTDKKIKDISDFYLHFADELARQRERTGLSLKEIKNLPLKFAQMDFTYFKKSVSILGEGRLIEALSHHFSLLGWAVRCVSHEEEKDVDYEPGECIIIATQSSHDRDLVVEAIAQQPAYVGMVGGRQRAIEVIEYLKNKTSIAEYKKIPLFIPAGIDIDAKNPNEIALSIVTEILKQIQAAI